MKSRFAITRASLVLLFCIGVVEAVWGFYLGRLLVYRFEAPFALEIKLAADDAPAFGRYMTLIKNSFTPIGYIGLITMLVSIIGFASSARSDYASSASHDNG
jgi:hypothetical protein